MSIVTLKKNGQELKDRIGSGQGLVNIVTRNKKKTIEEIRELIKYMNALPEGKIKRSYGLYECWPPEAITFEGGEFQKFGKDKLFGVTDALKAIEDSVPSNKKFDYDCWVMIFGDIHKSLEESLNIRLMKDILIGNEEEDCFVRRCLIIVDEVDGEDDLERDKTSIEKLPIDLHGYATNSVIWD